MRTESVEYKIYSFDELAPEVQNKVVDKMNDINIWEDWHECTLEYYKDVLASSGFEQADIHYSGFWSQGDGASFDAKCDIEKIIAKLISKDPENKKFKRLIKLANAGIVALAIETNSTHYCHERTRSIVMERYLCFDSSKHKRLKDLCSDFVVKAEELRLELCNNIYESLDKEYEYLTSKEAIVDAIKSNDFEFLESGKRYL